jgi:hypothetical protein
LLIRARIVDFDWRVSREILRWQPDLLHAHDANTLKIAMRCRSRAGVPFVYDAHELWEHRNAVRTARARATERRLLDRATRVMAGSVTVSPGIQNWMVDRYQLTVPPVLVRNIPPAPTNPASRSGDGCVNWRTCRPLLKFLSMSVGSRQGADSPKRSAPWPCFRTTFTW